MENEVMNKNEEEIQPKSRILKYFTEDQIRKLYYTALSLDIDDNNVRADIIKDICGDKFEELGVGTNRITLKRDQYAIKIALDRRGLVDSMCEFIRSPGLDVYCAKVYESNALITIMEYVTLMDQTEFSQNIEGIRTILKDLSRKYIFEDLGVGSNKNFANYGYRSNGTIVILDYGYLYPRAGNEDALICQVCGGKLEYNKNYTGFKCQNNICGKEYRVMDIRRRMDTSLEDAARAKLYADNGIDLPNFNKLADQLFK